MRSAIFLSVRNKATRLPGKVLLNLAGATVTERLIERLKLSREVDLIVAVTSTHPDDQVLVEIAQKMGVGVFCGSEDDKLDRYLQAARSFGVDLIVIVDGDDPFCDPTYIDRMVREAQTSDAAYITVSDLPVGITANVIRVSALERVCQIKTEQNTEVWGGYFTQTGLFQTKTLKAEPAHCASYLRMTLDYPEDYEFFQKVYDHLHRPGEVFSLDDIMNLIQRQPEIGEINQAVAAHYEENLKRITKIGIKEET